MPRNSIFPGTLPVVLLAFLTAGCATTPPVTIPDRPSTATVPVLPKEADAMPEPGAAEKAAEEGSELLIRIVETLSSGRTVDPREAARVVELLPQEPESWMAAGLNSYRNGDLDEAMERLTRSATLNPIDPVTLMALGETSLAREDLTGADRYFSIAHESSPTPETANRLALLRIEGGYLESAREILKGTLSAFPEDTMTRNNLAVALDMMGASQDGIALIGDEEVTDPRLLLTRALLELKQGRPDRAAADLESSFQGDLAETWLLLGASDLQKGEMGSASDKFRKAIEAAPDRYEGYLNLGLAQRRQGLFTDAESTYMEGIAAAPHPDLHLNLGILYELYRDGSGKALYQYRKYLEAGGAASARVEGWVKYLEGIVGNRGTGKPFDKLRVPSLAEGEE